jgi:hypothetical protein
VSDNWEKWNHDKPSFFTKKFVSSIPLSVLSEQIWEELDMADKFDEIGMEEREGGK